jgi:CDP-diacylglycerol--serine O-phosphatidyltransferase
MIKQSVPHFFTSLNLLSGCFSIYFAYIFQFETAFVFLLAGVFFDMWDGLLARFLGVESELGVQLDSMADMVTSGMAPGIILAQLFVLAGNHPLEVVVGWPINSVVEFIPWVFIGFILPLGSAFRLARFNINGSKKKSLYRITNPCHGNVFRIHSFNCSTSLLYLFKANSNIKSWINFNGIAFCYFNEY